MVVKWFDIKISCSSLFSVTIWVEYSLKRDCCWTLFRQLRVVTLEMSFEKWCRDGGQRSFLGLLSPTKDNTRQTTLLRVLPD